MCEHLVTTNDILLRTSKSNYCKTNFTVYNGVSGRQWLHHTTETTKIKKVILLCSTTPSCHLAHQYHHSGFCCLKSHRKRSPQWRFSEKEGLNVKFSFYDSERQTLHGTMTFEVFYVKIPAVVLTIRLETPKTRKK